jgi:hypothetical protein
VEIINQMPAKDDVAVLTQQLKDAGVSVVYKEDGWMWKAIAWIVMVVTFGKNKTFMTDFITTVGSKIGVPRAWDGWPDEMKAEILAHEFTHVKQAKKWTLPVFWIAYLFLPLPLGLAYCRYRFEREAYLAGFKMVMKYAPDNRQALIDQVVQEMTTSEYAWTWPFKKTVRAWFEARL